MGQCCNRAPTDTADNSTKLSILSTGDTPKHRPLHDQQSSGSQSTIKNTDTIFGQQTLDNTSNNVLNEDDSEEDQEVIDLSIFQEDVIEFIEFWHHHYETLSKDNIHNALVRRIHSKLKGICNLHNTRNFAFYIYMAYIYIHIQHNI